VTRIDVAPRRLENSSRSNGRSSVIRGSELEAAVAVGRAGEDAGGEGEGVVTVPDRAGGP